MKIFGGRKPKKASLDLSLNAIVILILAIALLGLGLAFIRGIFKNISAKVDEAVDAGEIQNPPTIDNPVTTVPSEFELKDGTTGSVKVAFLNTETTNTYYLLELYESGQLNKCASGATSVCNIKPIFSTKPFSMKKDQINIWTIAMSPNIGVSNNKVYLETVLICKVAASTATACPTTPLLEFRKDFIVTVKP